MNAKDPTYTDNQLAQAAEYLRSNETLRAAVGATQDALLEPRYLGVGEHNLNYAFREPASGRKFVLRVNVAPQPFHDNQVAYEFAALEALQPSGCTPLPVYLDDSADALGKGVLVETFCEGDELDFDNVKPDDLRQAARLMADVHAVPVDEECPLHRPKDPLRELFRECMQRFELYRSSAYEDARITRWIDRFVAAVKKSLDASNPQAADCAHVVNTEPLPSHFLIPDERADSREARGAFIDWERPIIGEVAQDVAYFTAPTTTFWDSDWMMPANVADDVVEEYWRAVDDRFPQGNFEERYRLFRAMTALRSATWCCRALITYNQPEAHQTAKTIQKLPVYLSDDFMHHIAEECFDL